MHCYLIAVFLILVWLKDAYCEIHRSKVIILGAGASGIAAARQLQQEGVTDFIIIDALPFVGGKYKKT
jgi:cation diffusion facilitator CzcD-associated flavoprotein CzcO